MNGEAIPFVGDNLWALVACALYFLVLVCIGLFSMRFSSQGQENFLLGGRKLNALVVGLSAVVSGRSAWLLLSVSGLAYINGIAAIWFAAGYTVVELILFQTAGKRLRRATEAAGDITLPDFLASRFSDPGKLLRLLSALIILVFMVTYVGAQVKAGGKALTAGFALPEWQGVLITGLMIMLYTAVGGFLAVSLTDVLQAFMMLFALIGLPLVAVFYFGGLGSVAGNIPGELFDLSLLPVGALIGALGIGLGSTGSPHILVRFMSIKNEKHLTQAGWLGFIWNVVMAAGAVSIGLIGRSAVAMNSLPGGDREMIFPVLAGILPPFLFGLVIASVFAAIMSTADSQLLVATSAAARDIYQRILRKGSPPSEKTMVHLYRILVISLCLAGIGIALFASNYVHFLVLLAWTGLGCTFGPVVILSLYWEKTTRTGVISGLLCGTITTFIWGLTPQLKSIVHEVVPVFFVTLAVTAAVSLMSSGNATMREN